MGFAGTKLRYSNKSKALNSDEKNIPVIIIYLFVTVYDKILGYLHTHVCSPYWLMSVIFISQHYISILFF